jgi:inosose dehydratase
MKMDRRNFLASVPVVAAGLAATPSVAAQYARPANKNIKWGVSTNIWDQTKAPYPEILDNMKESGFIGIRLRGFPGILERWGVTQAQLHSELSKRGLQAITISFGLRDPDPGQRQQVLDSAREAIKFLKDFGANHLVVFSPGRKPETRTPEAFKALCERCNQIGEIAGEFGFTAGLHNHMGQMVQTPEEVDHFMAMTDPKLFGLSPDTAHLHLGGSDVVHVLNTYKHRIRFLDYKDAKRNAPSFRDAICDLGDGEIDFPACHRVLKSVNYRGWVCVDLDTARLGPLEDYKRCGDYVVSKLQPIYL